MIDGLKPYPKYKDSGAPWLGQVPEHWEVRSLRSITSARAQRNHPDLPLLSVVRERGVILRKVMADNENHNFIPDDLSNYKVARRGDLVVNKMKAWQGSLGVAPCDGIVSPAYFVFRLSIADLQFGQYMLRSKPFVWAFARASDGVRIGQWDLSTDDMKQIAAPLPPRDEQRAIVRYIHHIEHLIARHIRSKLQLVKLLEEQKQIIVHRAVTRGLDHHAKLKPSGIEWLGAIPKHWTIRKLRHCGAIAGGMTPSIDRVDYWDGEIPWVTPREMKREAIDETTAHVSEKALSDTSLELIPKGAVLLVVRGMILARRVPVAFTTVPVTINQDMKAIVVGPQTRADFLTKLLSASQPIFSPLIDEAGHGTKRFPTERWSNLSFAFPPIAEQENIVNYLNAATGDISRTISRTESEIALVREYRTRLIADVVTGKLDVREATARLPVIEKQPGDGIAERAEEDEIDQDLAEPEEEAV